MCVWEKRISRRRRRYGTSNCDSDCHISRVKQEFEWSHSTSWMKEVGIIRSVKVKVKVNLFREPAMHRRRSTRPNFSQRSSLIALVLSVGVLSYDSRSTLI